jgi:hypothetical protein
VLNANGLGVLHWVLHGYNGGAILLTDEMTIISLGSLALKLLTRRTAALRESSWSFCSTNPLTPGAGLPAMPSPGLSDTLSSRPGSLSSIRCSKLSEFRGAQHRRMRFSTFCCTVTQIAIRTPIFTHTSCSTFQSAQFEMPFSSASLMILHPRSLSFATPFHGLSKAISRADGKDIIPKGSWYCYDRKRLACIKKPALV